MKEAIKSIKKITGEFEKHAEDMEKIGEELKKIKSPHPSQLKVFYEKLNNKKKVEEIKKKLTSTKPMHEDHIKETNKLYHSISQTPTETMALLLACLKEIETLKNADTDLKEYHETFKKIINAEKLQESLDILQHRSYGTYNIKQKLRSMNSEYSYEIRQYMKLTQQLTSIFGSSDEEDEDETDEDQPPTPPEEEDEGQQT